MSDPTSSAPQDEQATMLLKHLPVPVYCVDAEGYFLYANDALVGLLHLGSNYGLRRISEYYRDRDDRKRLLDAVTAAWRSGEATPRQTAQFLIHGDERMLAVHCVPLGADDPPHAFVGCLLPADDLPLEALFDALGIPALALDQQGCLKRGNKALSTLFGYASPDQMIGVALENLVAGAHPVTASPSQHLVRLRTRHPQFARLDRVDVMQATAHEKPVATVQPVALTTAFAAAFDELPLGVYAVQRIDEDDIVLYASPSLAKILGLELEEVVGWPMSSLHGTQQGHAEFYREFRAAISAGARVFEKEAPTTLRDGSTVLLHVYCVPLFDAAGDVCGRLGVLRQLGDEAIREARKVLQEDFGTLMHGINSSFSSWRSWLGRVRSHLSDAALRGLPDKSLDSHDTLLRIGREAYSKLPQDVPIDLIGPFEQILTGGQPAAVVRARLGDLCGRLIKYLDGRIGTAPRERLKLARSSVTTLSALCLFQASKRINEMILESSQSIMQLQEMLEEDAHSPHPDGSSAALRAIIDSALGAVTEYALSKQIDFKTRVEDDPLVTGPVTPLVRALTNVLHNAVKYSFTRRGGRGFVSLEARYAAPFVEIVVENYGVGVPVDEQESAFLYRMGTRGRWSSERSRVGTGVGLADTRRILRQRRGAVTLKSRPAPDERKPTSATPHITTVTLRFAVKFDRSVNP